MGSETGKRPGGVDPGSADPVLDVCPTSVAVIDAGNRIEWVNQPLLDLFGYRRGEVVGETLSFLLPALDAIEAKGELADLAQPILATATTADGNGTEARVWIGALGAEAPQRRVAFIENFQPGSNAAVALRESERQFLEVVEITDDLVTKIDADGRFLFLNHSAKRLFGLSPEECVGLDAFQFVHPEDRAPAQQEYREWLSGRGHTATFENRSISRTGEVHRMLWTVNARYSDDGGFLGTWSIARDITHRQALEDAERRHLEAQVQLGAERARADFRREVLRRSIFAQEEERRRIAGELHHEAGQTLLDITRKLHRVEIAGDLNEARREARDAQRDLQHAMGELRRLAGGLRPAALDDLGLGEAIRELVNDASATLPVSLTCDELPRRIDPAVETVIYRVVQQALNNSIQHAAARQVRVWLSYRNQTVTAVVEDNGRGFDEDKLPSHSHGLTGMRDRASAVGGRLTIAATPGSGVRVRLDVHLDDDPDVDEGTTTVLIAGCHPILREGLKRMLETQEGLEVTAEADDRGQLVRRVRAHHPSAVVLDPDGWPNGTIVDGVADVKAVSRHTGVVVLTSEENPRVMRDLLEAGADAYLLKDADLTELTEGIRRAARGASYVQPALGARLARLEDDDPMAALSDRELEVLRLLALGHTNQEIAGKLYLSVRTVEAHRTHINQKLGISSRADLVRCALQGGLLLPADSAGRKVTDLDYGPTTDGRAGSAG